MNGQSITATAQESASKENYCEMKSECGNIPGVDRRVSVSEIINVIKLRYAQNNRVTVNEDGQLIVKFNNGQECKIMVEEVFKAE